MLYWTVAATQPAAQLKRPRVRVNGHAFSLFLFCWQFKYPGTNKQTNKQKQATLIILLVTPKPGPCYTEQRQPHSSPAQACFKQAKPRNIYETKGVGKWTCFLFLSFRLKLQKRLGASGRQQSILYVVQSTPASPSGQQWQSSGQWTRPVQNAADVFYPFFLG